MDDIVTGKQHLPTPFNRDLSKVLRNLDRSTDEWFVSAANHPLTAAFLHAGMTLIRNELGPGAKRRPAVPGEEGSVERRALDFLSQREVVKQMRKIEEPFERNDKAEGALRGRWKSHCTTSQTCCGSACGRSSTAPTTPSCGRNAKSG